MVTLRSLPLSRCCQVRLLYRVALKRAKRQFHSRPVLAEETAAPSSSTAAERWGKSNGMMVASVASGAALLLCMACSPSNNPFSSSSPSQSKYDVTLYSNADATVRCEAPVASGTTTSFQVMAALDMRDEVQKVRMAQILHDLHELAKSAKGHGDDESSINLQKRGTMRQMWKFLRGSKRNKNSKSSSRNAYMNVNNRVFKTMTPTKAHELIQKLEKVDKKGAALLHPSTVVELIHAAETILLQDDTLVDLRKRDGIEKVTVVGDLHGSIKSLQHVLTLVGGGNEICHKDHILVFDGDFVDRGDNSLEVLLVLLLLKLAYPTNVYLVRGNHEDVLVASAYGFQDEVVSKYGSGEESEEIWNAVNAAFCALPLCVVTDTAAILHGGLPSADFSLDQLKNVTSEQRKELTSMVEPQNDLGRLVQGILWSDPSKRRGIRPNTTRSIGNFFGPDITHDFLERHSLKYLVRGHEVVQKGTKVMDCGDGRAVVTVFSQSNYPNSAGDNLGALIDLTKDGGLDQVEFSRMSELQTALACSQDEDHYMHHLKSLIARNKNKLWVTFRKEAPDGTIPTSQWASILSHTLDLPQVPWLVLCPDLTATASSNQSSNNSTMVDWKAFLELYDGSHSGGGRSLDSVCMEALHANEEMLMTTFQFLDTSGNGTIDREEFKAGITLLNKRLGQNKKLQVKDTNALFDKIDTDGSGEIDLAELADWFKVM